VKANKIIGTIFLVLAAFTVIGMAINSDAYWSIYNYATILISVVSAVVLFRQK
jgi:hypothetical protein